MTVTWIKSRPDVQRRERRTTYTPDGRFYTVTLDVPPAGNPRWYLEANDADGDRIGDGRWFVSLDACTQAVDELEAQR
jgi:hypothetical protein